MIPALALALVQGTTVPLTPFTDDGQTKTHAAPPAVLTLTKGVATIPVGTKAVRAWVSGAGLTVDRNGNGKPDANERVPTQRRAGQGQDGKPLAMAVGTLDLGPGARYSARFFTPDSRSSDVAEMRGKLVLLPLSGFVGTARLGGKAYRIGIRGTGLGTAALFIDRDGDGRLGTVQQEMYPLGQPFSLGGGTYRATSFVVAGRPSVTFAKATQKVAEIPMPADLRVGKVFPPVPGRTLGGKAVTFPKSFPGKVVLLDVWATWCGPCKGEIPFMRDAYARYRKRGFEIVSMSIDDPGMGPQVAAFTKANGMAWTQVFQGQGWRSPVCQRYNITGIPFMILVDGSTGKILAREESLRGPGTLARTLESTLAMRGQ